VLPPGNCPRRAPDGVELRPAEHVGEAIAQLLG